MLPETGTPERAALEQEAHDVAMVFLREEFNNIPNALYRTYMHFRQKFLDAYPEVDSVELLTDARVLEAVVADDWAHSIRERFQDAENAERG